MNDYRWIQHKSEGLYYAELQELIQTIDWTLAWKQLKEAFLPYIQIWDKACSQVIENLRNNPEFIAAAKNYEGGHDVPIFRIQIPGSGFSMGTKTYLRDEMDKRAFSPVKESKDKGLTQKKYIEMTNKR
jgi:hypothetical protein